MSSYIIPSVRGTITGFPNTVVLVEVKSIENDNASVSGILQCDTYYNCQPLIEAMYVSMCKTYNPIIIASSGKLSGTGNMGRRVGFAIIVATPPS